MVATYNNIAINITKPIRKKITIYILKGNMMAITSLDNLKPK